MRHRKRPPINDWLKHNALKNDIAYLHGEINNIHKQLDSNQRLLRILISVMLMMILAWVVV